VKLTDEQESGSEERLACTCTVAGRGEAASKTESPFANKECACACMAAWYDVHGILTW